MTDQFEFTNMLRNVRLFDYQRNFIEELGAQTITFRSTPRHTELALELNRGGSTENDNLYWEQFIASMSCIDFNQPRTKPEPISLNWRQEGF